ncbi:Thiol:disulfide oxidoreductase TlpA [hydrothermal vent metagenome]|uniref:Thiol:disulfide oxidoreductase TlpA n=1 Tax=hydrothermal vent metagenome TaxID=652676 RepID=A0A3B0S330_9ZZZZ
MRLIRPAVLYIAAGLGAIAAVVFFITRDGPPQPVVTVDYSALMQLRDGDMKKLNFHPAPKPVSTSTFESEDGTAMTLADYKGKYILLNFWATWCAPCRREMPMLSDIQTAMGGDNFAVVTIATGRNPPPAIKKFFSEIGVDNLPRHRDPKSLVGNEMGIFGLPVTMIIDPSGQEIARLTGDAEWNSDSAKAIISALITQ